MRPLPLAALAGCALTMAVSAQAETPLFPVVLGPATTQTRAPAKPAPIIYGQTFRPEAVVATTTDVTTRLRTHKMLSNKDQTVVIPAGTLFIKAYFRNTAVYCTAFEQIKGSLLQGTYFEGVCLGGDDGNGRFSQVTYLTPNNDVEGPAGAYEVLDSRDDAETEAADVGYTVVPVDDRFESHIQLKATTSDRRGLYVSTEVRYPAALAKNPDKFYADTIIWADDVSDFVLTTAAWPTKFPLHDGAGQIDFGAGIAADATWSDDKSLGFSWTRTLPEGEYMMQLVGTTQRGGGAAMPMDIYAFRLDPNPGAGTPVAGGK